ncbi:MAG TPA: hypothetical protein VMX54_12435 [Vicinamibacteria bacterium]|nr:hypothetical protein [Vicinamibacteria bacterium]
MLAVYVSGHGFGHATRTAEVLRVVREMAPRLPIVAATAAPAFLLEEVIAPPLAVRRVAADVGLVQKDALVIDEEGTAFAWRAYRVGWDELVAAEARWLQGAGARLVLGDIPPLAFAAAAAAGVPSIALGNFSWDWIYDHLARSHPALEPAAAWARAAYADADLLLRLPFAGDLRAFRRIEPLPMVARRPAVARAEARERLGLDPRPAVLLSFGGIGLPGLRASSFADPRFQFLVTGLEAGGGADGVRSLDGTALRSRGLDYPDLVGAVDVVVTKPGYGIVSDCIGARTRLVYTERGDFPEYPVMVQEMPRYLPAVHLANADLRQGRVGAALGRVLALPWPDPPRLDGARVAASLLLERL